MRRTTWGIWLLGVSLLLGAAAAPTSANAEDGLGMSDFGQPVTAQELGGVSIGNSLFAVTDVTQNSSISDGTVAANNGGAVNNGAIHHNAVSGNSGMTTVFNNTGNLVNMTHSTVYNIFLNSGVSTSH